MNIGKIKLKNNLFLAPMVDVTDVAYRELCTGAGMKYTEMLYVDSILHTNQKTEDLMVRGKKEEVLGLQITGDSEEEFERFVDSRKWEKFDLIDLNCGCPSIRITGNKAGSFLMKSPKKIGRIVRILKRTGKTVTVKIRLGFKKNNVLEVAKEVENAGADALTVHGRLSIHGRSVPADWKWLKKVKGSVDIPVIGNGDVFSCEDYLKMIEETGVDGVMIARGAIGDPGIFDRILEGSEFDFKKNLELFSKYLKLEKKYYGSRVDMGRVKYVGTSFLKGFRGAAKARGEFVKIKDISEMEGFVRELPV